MNQNFRNQFPALSRIHNGQKLTFLDGPAGTQVPEIVINAISDYYKNSNSNTHGHFITTRETDAIMDSTREKVATFLGAENGHTISFGQNMTTLNFSLSKAIARYIRPGEEILITQLDHESNRGPWLTLRENGIVVREVKLKPDGALDYKDFESKINENTRLVAMGWAANILGTVNDVQKIRTLTHQVGAWLLIDAVHFAPHFPIDVQAVGCDFLLCSAYKFYGPHVGLLYSKPGILDRLQPDRLRTTIQTAPYTIETGTLNHAAIAGVKAAIEFIAELGKGKTERAKIINAMETIHEHEIALAKKLYKGLSANKKVQIIGQPIDAAFRAPTISFTYKGKTADEVCDFLSKENVFGWTGNFYAVRASEVLGLEEKGGVTRLGISAYNIDEDVEKAISVLNKL